MVLCLGTMILNLPSHPNSRISPYSIAVAGALLFSPTGNQIDTLSGAQLQAKPAFVYCVGPNYAIQNTFLWVWSIEVSYTRHPILKSEGCPPTL